MLGGLGVFVGLGGLGVLEGFGVLEGLGVLVGLGVNVEGGIGVAVGTGAEVRVGSGVTILVGIEVKVPVGNAVGVVVGVWTVDTGDVETPPDAVTVRNTEGSEDRVKVGVGVGELVEVTEGVEVAVTVDVALATTDLLLSGLHGSDVGVKKSLAYASCVSIRSSAVGVDVFMGTRVISSCVSGLPPAIMIGKKNAMAQAPMTTNNTTALRNFTLLCRLS